MDSLEKSWIEVVNKSWIVMNNYFFLSAYVVESWLGHGRVWLGHGRVWLGHGRVWLGRGRVWLSIGRVLGEYGWVMVTLGSPSIVYP